ncbi:hypothetical protein HF577_36405 [Pseudonocardia xinjiangensis]|uniref:Uncharacterized protein n=1 Tax=Pseudonocardia xinjiangensis TaxID=75289 RepID=A0ABX1RTA2_9PSEU|nr:hypothetical protein [Pseudonocardia xinjiangensis]NMH82555.1 hypothetical protein [Pseudonocardia xinjiangensis]
MVGAGVVVGAAVVVGAGLLVNAVVLDTTAEGAVVDVLQATRAVRSAGMIRRARRRCTMSPSLAQSRWLHPLTDA